MDKVQAIVAFVTAIVGLLSFYYGAYLPYISPREPSTEAGPLDGLRDLLTQTTGSGSTTTQGSGSTTTQGSGSTTTQGSGSTTTQGSGSTTTDTTPPVIEASIDGTEGDNGWYISDVEVTWNVNDDESDITTSHGCDPIPITEDTGGTDFTCEATSEGGSNSRTVTISRDTTPPDITCIDSEICNGGVFAVEGGVPSEPGCEATDDMSGVDECEVSGYGTDVGSYTITFAATDYAGNTVQEEVSYDIVVG